MGHAFITAGTKGLGKKVTEAMLAQGHSVTVTYFRDEERAGQIKDLYTHYPLHIVQADVCNKESIEKAVREAYETFGTIDYLIHNAGPFIFDRKKLLDHTEEEWKEMVHGNLSSMFYLAKHVIPMMRKHASGWVKRSAFAAAKVGLVSLTKTIAYEEAENGITANMISPGDINGTMKEATIAQSRESADNNTPIGRSGTGEDIARTVLYLCEDNSDMITGTVIDINGGLDVIHQNR
ncbi:SDR family oxidoreductase [Gracilibacillus oryzae]|uniref:SDR family oxidoreductase n=1 Tax=Gracilibacillus oryzae TaxID=1672701 RepID=A0A7C8GUA0_9BACI|nr:SDR family oxidoreductase [Gracilibacillus oryzae]KAB8138275.1 SDR family oxidoreductase [Gracilibacillus oryzae]